MGGRDCARGRGNGVCACVRWGGSQFREEGEGWARVGWGGVPGWAACVWGSGECGRARVGWFVAWRRVMMCGGERRGEGMVAAAAATAAAAQSMLTVCVHASVLVRVIPISGWLFVF
jgi:hypothetical protein